MATFEEIHEHYEQKAKEYDERRALYEQGKISDDQWLLESKVYLLYFQAINYMLGNILLDLQKGK